MKRGQAATEYILVATLLFVILIPAIFLFMTYMKNSTEDLALSKLNKIGNDIVQSASEVYYLGEPAKITLQETIPDGLKSMSIEKNWTKNPPVNHLVFVVSRQGKSSDMVFISDVNINGIFTGNMISKGTKNIIVQANRTIAGTPFVSITIK